MQPSRGRMVNLHHRTRSDSGMLDICRPRSDSNSSSSDMDEEFPTAVPMVRKKSGEVVKSSLKSPCRSRPCSMPSTPTFSKNVHFDARIEHVRHFRHSERPSAVSVGSSPVEGVYDAESEYPFGCDDEPTWEINLPNFPKDLESRKSMMVRLEKVFLSNDGKTLSGTVAVANIAFQKSVVARFTFDYWRTVSEVIAEYKDDVRRRERDDGVDRFTFNIKLTEQANLEKKILFFCIRYNSGGQEHWDNNCGVNFQVDFNKAAPIARSAGHQSNALPRSLPRSSKPCAATLASRPRSMPSMDDDDEIYRPTDRKLKKAKPPVVDDEVELPSRRANPTGNAFGNRYDFRTSLSAAIKAQAQSSPPQSQPIPVLDLVVITPPMEPSYFNLPAYSLKTGTLAAELATTTPLDSPSISGAGPPEIFSGTENFWMNEDKPSIESPSYRELIDNYCFFGSSKLMLPIACDRPSSQHYTTAPQTGSSHSSPQLSVAQPKPAASAPMSYTGYHHRRRGSGPFRFDTTTKTPTAIC